MKDFTPPNNARYAQFHDAQRKAIYKVSDHILRAKGKWMTALMAKLLPVSIFKLCYSKNRAEQQRASRFMEDNGIMLKDHPDRSELVVGDKILGEFKVEFQHGRPVVFVRNAKTIERLSEP